MPELPEVETIKRDLSRLIVGKEILDVETDSPKQIQPSFGVAKKAVVGTTIKKIERRAKLLQIFLSNGKILVIHLKMTGQLLVRKKGIVRERWQHITFALSGNKELRFADLRKFGWIRLITNKKDLEKLLSDIGPEPLKDLTLKEFGVVVQSTRRAIKTLLMDQTKIAGIGNIYANDALWDAAINPKKPANKLSNEQIKKLFDAIERVLKEGLKKGGASDQYYVTLEGGKGTYQKHFLVYGKEGVVCTRCKKEKIKKIKLSGRGTFFCTRCQK